MSTRIERTGWTVDVPDVWTVVAGRVGVRCFHDALVKNDDSLVEVHSGDEVSIENLVLEPAASMEELAAERMKRHNPYGQLDVETRVVNQRSARYYEWSTGVQSVETFFVRTGATTAVCIQAAQRVRFDGDATGQTVELDIARLLAAITWTTPRCL